MNTIIKIVVTLSLIGMQFSVYSAESPLNNFTCSQIDSALIKINALVDNHEYKKAIQFADAYNKLCYQQLTSSPKKHINLLNNLSFSYWKSPVPDEKKMLSVGDHYIKVSAQVYGETDPRFASALNRKATILMELNEYKTGLSYQEKALQIQLKSLPQHHADIGQSYNNMGLFFRKLLKPIEARQAFEKSLFIRERTLGRQHPDYAWTLNNLANLLSDQGHNKEALALYEKALAIFKVSSANDLQALAGMYTNIGVIYHLEQNYDKALSLYNRAYDLYVEFYGKEHLRTALVLNNIAEVFLETSRFKLANEYFERSINIRKKYTPETSTDLAWSYSYVAELQFNYQQYEKALIYSDTALNIWHQAFDNIPQSQLSLFILKGEIYAKIEQENKLHSAVEQYLTAVKLHLIKISSNEFAFRDFIKKEQNNLEKIIALLLVRKTAKQATTDQLLWEVVNIANWNTVTLDSNFRLSYTQNIKSTQLKELFDLTKKRGDIELHLTMLSKSKNLKVTNNLRSKLIDVNDEIMKIDQSKILQNIEIASTTPLRYIQDNLDTDEALVSYFFGEKLSIAFLIKKNSYELLPITTNKVTLAKQINSILDFSHTAGSIANIPPFNMIEAHKLYLDIFAPFKPYLNQINNVKIFNNSAIASIPFSILPTVLHEGVIDSFISFKQYAEFKWLTDDYQIERLVSYNKSQHVKSNEGNNILAIGGASLSAETSKKRGIEEVDLLRQNGLADVNVLAKLPSLPFAQKELVESLILGGGNSKLLVQASATEQNFKTLVSENYTYISIATHAVYATGKDQLSQNGLVFTPPKIASEEDDGLLTHREIRALKLNTKLVILSGCNTAGSVNQGNRSDLTGLASSFIYAGSDAVAVSFWAINDNATYQLMSHFYRIYANNEIAPHEALHQAQRAYLNSDLPGYMMHPLFWGGFEIISSSL
jgi:CHAT domain-containing protein/tetratricopeptide (TPR) repeat protein